jgi:hypothetical protein
VKPQDASPRVRASRAAAIRTAQPDVPCPSRHAATTATMPSSVSPAARIQPGARIHSALSAAAAATAASQTGRGLLR